MLFTALVLAVACTTATTIPAHDAHDHSHPVNKRLPSSTWYQPSDHQAHSLFKRATDDGVDYAPVGSPAWSSAFPVSSPDPARLPVEWVNALNAAVADGKIPDIPRTTNTPQTNPVYPAGVNPASPEVCSATYKCRNSGDIWDAPAGHFGTAFDDGPQPFTTPLVQFLDVHNEKATHFMIGVNILAFPQEFLLAFESDNDIAVHTWTHPYMTTLSNLELLGQFGYTMELIHNSTGGRVPRYWRPPYGDSDNRVRAVAKEVFGLETIVWNRDTSDWSMANGGTTPQAVNASMTEWLTGPKDPGLLVLEHETSQASVQAFIDAYPVIKANGWNMASAASLWGDVYQNAESSSSDDVVYKNILADSDSTSPTESPSSSSSEPASTPTPRPQTTSRPTTTSGAETNTAPPATDTDLTNSATSIWCCDNSFRAMTMLLGAVVITVASTWA